MKSLWLDIGLVLLFACLWTETELRPIKARPISSYLDLTNLVKQRFTIPKNYFLAVLRGQDSAIFPAWVVDIGSVALF